MRLDDLLEQTGSWLSSDFSTGCVISSRVRLARNIKGSVFPGWASDEDSLELCETLRPLLMGLPSLKDSLFMDMDTIEPMDKQVLMERHLISSELAEKGAGSGLVVSPDETCSAMINEEDHLRLQVISPGIDLGSLLEVIDRFDSELESVVDFAYSPRLGYLTSCPSNVGTGLRASVMLHLPGLRLLDEVDPIVRGLNKIGLTVRGLLGEGTEPSGDMYQISNQMTLGESESTIIRRLHHLVTEVTGHEKNARQRVLESREAMVRDFVGRSFGILTHAYTLSSKEALDLLSGLRLGVEFRMIGEIETRTLNELLLLTQPGHLQKIEQTLLGPEERDCARARIIREKLKDAVIER